MPRGKTPLPAGERRDHLLMFRMNDAEQTALRRLAGRKPLAQYIRAALFKALPRAASAAPPTRK